jgi:hypothetical protein
VKVYARKSDSGVQDVSDKPEGSALMTVDIELPCCGCRLKMSIREEGTLRGQEQRARCIKFGAERLTYWVENRSGRHRCALVSDINPMGLVSQ